MKKYRAECTPQSQDKEMQRVLFEIAKELADSPFLEIDNQYIMEHPTILREIQRHNKQACWRCLSANCWIKQKISRELNLQELLTDSGCNGNPKSTFADIRTPRGQASSAEALPPAEAPQASAPSVSAFFDELDEEIDQANAARGFRINIVGLRLGPVDEPLDEPEEEDVNLLTNDPQQPSNQEGLDEERDPSPGENPQQSASSKMVLEFFKELDAEENPLLVEDAQQPFGSGEAPTSPEEPNEENSTSPGIISAPTFAAACKIKRPDITEHSIPTKFDVQRGGFRSCIICMKPNISMYAMKVHVTAHHSIRIGDPLDSWLRAAQR